MAALVGGAKAAAGRSKIGALCRLPFPTSRCFVGCPTLLIIASQWSRTPPGIQPNLIAWGAAAKI
jgi:hypothetical protein